ncbi:hypothetical protein Enr13x_71760 [Stieleria neptunia]|uniref:Uncharacterized protein n=1 Tax=Stieleria neptunia TaxID=2527979 RepID=A0A518I2M3_9BACT|nr:hypothetical protein Enr13x_71760 [Stieleria neptunia]
MTIRIRSDLTEEAAAFYRREANLPAGRVKTWSVWPRKSSKSTKGKNATCVGGRAGPFGRCRNISFAVHQTHHQMTVQFCSPRGPFASFALYCRDLSLPDVWWIVLTAFSSQWCTSSVPRRSTPKQRRERAPGRIRLFVKEKHPRTTQREWRGSQAPQNHTMGHKRSRRLSHQNADDRRPKDWRSWRQPTVVSPTLASAHRDHTSTAEAVGNSIQFNACRSRAVAKRL